jgi:phosphinothricin acetyltransferase
MVIRAAVLDDLPRLLDIYNHYVVNTHVTFDIEALSIDVRRLWFDELTAGGSHRLFVSESNGQVNGYASSGTFRKKIAYARSVETSIYLDPDACGSGVGRDLYSSLLKDLEGEVEVHRAYGGVALPNEASIALHHRLGFERVATFREVGFKFGRYWDVAWFERAL